MAAFPTVAATHRRTPGVAGTALMFNVDVFFPPALVAALIRTALTPRCAFWTSRCPWKGADRGCTGREGKSKHKNRSESDRHGHFLAYPCQQSTLGRHQVFPGVVDRAVIPYYPGAAALGRPLLLWADRAGDRTAFSVSAPWRVSRCERGKME